MRILMISDVYFPRVNGVSTSIQTFSRELTGKGHEVTLIAPDYGPPRRSGGRQAFPPANDAADERRDRESEGFDIIRIPSRYLPIDPEDRILRRWRIRPHREQLTRKGFDLVHIQTPFVAHYAGLGLSRRLGVPVVESYHTYFEQYLDKYVAFLPSSWLRLAARRFSAAQCSDVDAVVVPSRAMLSVLESYGVRTPTAVIPTGIELARFAHGDGGRFRRLYGIPAERPVLVHVGRLAFEKNVDFLLRMLVRVRREISDVLLVIAGEGPARGRLELLTEQLGLRDNLLFVGYLSREGALEDCYCAGDAFVFASRTETQGLVLLEAMALGIPVVSTAVMGTKEVLEGGQGSLIAAEDEADFASKAARLLADQDLRATLATQARTHARSWSAPHLADRMLDFYRTVIGTASGPVRPMFGSAREPQRPLSHACRRNRR
jgi:glycosyltransferase involved in cell wall biosynthesis